MKPPHHSVIVPFQGVGVYTLSQIRVSLAYILLPITVCIALNSSTD